MCTAMGFRAQDFYFGRTLDYEMSFGEEVVITPRNFPLKFRFCDPQPKHYAMVGIARVEGEYPLYFDAVNEMGLAMAGLNFVGFAHYRKAEQGKKNVAHFELISWVLAQCANVAEARNLLQNAVITDTPFSSELPQAQLHWILADATESIVVEAVEEGLRIYDNPVGILTNSPTFPEQMLRLNDYAKLTSGDADDSFLPEAAQQRYSRGMGAQGLPGDWSSMSRFARAAFVGQHGVKAETEWENVGQVFRMMGAVAMPKGCCCVGDGEQEYTRYTVCANATRGIYYYTTYHQHQITAVDMQSENLDDGKLLRYHMICRERIHWQNG